VSASSYSVHRFQEMFATLHSDLDRISFEQDSQDYARLRGTQMPPNWPMFEGACVNGPTLHKLSALRCPFRGPFF
jgi:hypothetical protein